MYTVHNTQRREKQRKVHTLNLTFQCLYINIDFYTCIQWTTCLFKSKKMCNFSATVYSVQCTMYNQISKYQNIKTSRLETRDSRKNSVEAWVLRPRKWMSISSFPVLHFTCVSFISSSVYSVPLHCACILYARPLPSSHCSFEFLSFTFVHFYVYRSVGGNVYLCFCKDVYNVCTMYTVLFIHAFCNIHR